LETTFVARKAAWYEMCAVDSVSGYTIYGNVRAQLHVPGTMKSLIFASIGEKLELVFIDTINNDVEIVKNADKILIYDRPLPPLGQLLWKDLVAWWQVREGLEDEKLASCELYRWLAQAVRATNSPGEFALFRKYYERFGKQLGDKLPALIPQVYLHYDPYTNRERGDEEFLARQRMDFLLMLENRVRIVIEVDGRQHYATADPQSGAYIADPTLYGKTCLEDRRLPLLGYEVYRFGGSEFMDTDPKTSVIWPRSEVTVLDFFDKLLKKHGVIRSISRMNWKIYTPSMYAPESAVVQMPGGKVVWLKEKGPEHKVSEYWILCWLGPNAFRDHKQLFDRVQACSAGLIPLAIVSRNYEAKRKAIQEFHDRYLIGPVTIPFDAWNGHIFSLEEAVVDIESFYWFGNRLLTRVALTLNYFFKRVRQPQVAMKKKILSHATLVESTLFGLLPPELQASALYLNEQIAEFRNEHVEHEMQYWRKREAEFTRRQIGTTPEVGMTLEKGGKVYPERPLRELWISVHDYITDVAKFLGSQIG